MSLEIPVDAFICVRSLGFIISGVALSLPDNDGDQRAATVDIDLTRNQATAAPLHPMVRPNFGVGVPSIGHLEVQDAVYVINEYGRPM